MAPIYKHRYRTESGETMTLYTRASSERKAGENWVFYAMDYFATGEGRTLMFLIDKTSDERQAMQDFLNFCGPHYSASVEKLSQEDFLERYEFFLPPNLKTMLKHPKPVSSIRFLQELHFSLA